jgi:hypothetical protein
MFTYNENAVNRRLPTAADRIRSQFKSVFCHNLWWQSGTGASFLRPLRFPLPILIPPTAPHSSSITLSWYSRSVSGRRTKWTESHPTPRNKKAGLKLRPLRVFCLSVSSSFSDALSSCILADELYNVECRKVTFILCSSEGTLSKEAAVSFRAQALGSPGGTVSPR